MQKVFEMLKVLSRLFYFGAIVNAVHAACTLCKK